MVTAYQLAAGVVDPELPMLTIADLGILREVRTDHDRVVVTITPTYAACPAMDTIRTEIVAALRRGGWPEVEVVTTLHPPWTTDWITPAGREKLAAAGIAPPGPVAGSGRSLPLLPPALTCPRCGSSRTEQVSVFGATACTSIWRCRACAEPFPHVKAF